MPLKSQLHVDQLLSNVSVKYSNAELIAMKIFPEVPVKKDSDLFRVYERNFRIPETKRATGGEARQHDFKVSTSSYNLEKHALKDYVADDAADNYDLADLRADTTEELTDVILRRMEKSVADLFTTTNWSLNVSLTAAQAFNLDTTASNPIPVYDTACTTVINNSGFKPNMAVIPRDGFVAIKNHQSVLDRVKYTSRDMTPAMLGGLFDIQEILIANGAYDSSHEGATTTMTQFFGDISFVGYKPQRPGPKQASAGYIFRKNTPMVRRWRVEEREAEAIEVQMKYQAKVVASLAGYLIKDIV
jgi:hypothetical protein